MLLAVSGRAAAARGPEELVLHTYHDKAPYYSPGLEDPATPGRCIYVDLAVYLNARQRAFQVRIEYLPRARLNRRLEQGDLPGGVIGVHPLWFRDKDRTRHLWTPPFMSDRDVVVVARGRAFPYAHPRDLAGKTVTLPRGLYYWGVTELIAEGKIRGEETERELQNLQKVARGRADATITSIYAFRNMAAAYGLEGQLEILPAAHDEYDRMILLPRGYEKAYAAIEPLLRGALNDPAWLDMLAVHGYGETAREGAPPDE
ncbi:MAG: transporter substrate-binding domain-containing protein [Lentisphaerae bacterium]|nr:transporter substrate-binding domain-containing protein [Lentisphaerota bacterium]